MSEEKVIKHTEHALDIIKSKSMSYKEKIKGFIEEIIIIIIAVSITLMFHNWNDERHERAIERKFLVGIKADLQRTADQLNLSVKGFQPTLDYYKTVWKQIGTHHIDANYVDSLSGYLENTSYFVFDNSRFEGFKSSGYLRLIENEQLLKHLVVLYSIYMPFEREADINIFHTRELDFNQYIGMRTDFDANGNFNLSKLLGDRAVQYQFIRYIGLFEERRRQKQLMIKKTLDLVAEIDEELKK